MLLRCDRQGNRGARPGGARAQHSLRLSLALASCGRQAVLWRGEAALLAAKISRRANGQRRRVSIVQPAFRYAVCTLRYPIRVLAAPCALYWAWPACSCWTQPHTRASGVLDGLCVALTICALDARAPAAHVVPPGYLRSAADRARVGQVEHAPGRAPAGLDVHVVVAAVRRGRAGTRTRGRGPRVAARS